MHPAAARARRNEVLAKLAQLGYITRGRGARRRAAPLGSAPQQLLPANVPDNYFFNFIRTELIDRYGANDGRDRADCRSTRRSTRTFK